MSTLKVDTIRPRSASTITFGESGDTIAAGSGVTLSGFGTTISNDANNRITTADGSGGLNAEANLNFDGTNLDLGSTTSTSTATPLTIGIGGTYSNSAGNNPKLKIWEDATYYMGLGVSANKLEFINSRDIYDFVFYGGGSEIVRIEGTGNVGIGTTSPAFDLDVNGNVAATRFYVQSGGNAVDPMIRVETDTNTGFFFPAADTIAVTTGGSERMRIDSSGNVGIGTSSPATKLDVNGDMYLRQTGYFNFGTNSGNRWADTSGNGGTTIGTYGSVNGTNGNFVAISSNASQGFANMYLNRIDVGSNEQDNSTRFIDFYYDGVSGVRLTGNDQKDIAFWMHAGGDFEIHGGNVGIGTSSPSQKLEVSGNILLGDNNNLYLGTSGDLAIYHDGSNSYIKDQGTGDLRIIGDNNVDILNSTGNKISIRCQASSAVNLYYDNSNKLQTTSSGINVTGTVTETSSIEYKENVQPLEFNEAIYNVNAVKYDRKDGSQKDEVGVIAEDLYEILPDLVQTKDGKPESVKYTKLTMYLLEALKKQNEEIQELKKRIN